MNAKDLEKKLKEAEAAKERAGKALSEAWTSRGEAGKEVAKAKEGLHRLRAASDVEAQTFTFRQQWKHAKERVEAAERREAEAAEAVRLAQEKYDAAFDAVFALQTELAAPRLAVLKEKVAGHLKAMRAHHEAALAEARQLVALHADAVAAAPARIVSKRAIGRYLLVRPTDLALRESIGASLSIPGVEPGGMHLEYYKAMKETAPGGRFEFVPGVEQDLIPPDENDRNQVEIIKSPGRLPEEVEAIEKIDLGILFEPNGKPPQPGKKRTMDRPRRLDFRSLEQEVRREKVAVAEK